MTESALTQRGQRHPALASYLTERDWRVTYITTDFYHAEKRWFSEQEIERVSRRLPYRLLVLHSIGYRKNISIRRVLSNLLVCLKALLILMRERSTAGWLLLASRPVELIGVAALACRAWGYRVAVDIQDIWPDMLPHRSWLTRTAFRLYCNSWLQWALRWLSSQAFFHVAPSFTQWLNRYAPHANSTFVPLGFDERRWASVTRPSSRPGNRILTLACVSKLSFQIDVLPILQAMARLRTFRLFLVGEDGTGERFPAVERFAKQHRLTGFVNFGVVPRNVVPGILSKADIGVVPMVSTSLPNKVFDYLGAGLPILALGNNDISRFVEDRGVGWSAPFSPSGVASFLENLSLSTLRRVQEQVLLARLEYSTRKSHEVIESLLSSRTVPCATTVHQQ